MGKHKQNVVEKDSLDREIKWLLAITIIAFLVVGSLPYLTANYIIPLVQYADASQFYLTPDEKVFLRQPGAAATCAVTGPASVVTTAPSGGARTVFQESDTADPNGCTSTAFILEDSLFPSYFDPYLSSPFGEIRGVTDIDDADISGSGTTCRFFVLDELPLDNDIVDPRVNATRSYEIFDFSPLTSWGGSFVRCIASNAQRAEGFTMVTPSYTDRTNQTFWAWGISASGGFFGRPSLIDNVVRLDPFVKWAFTFPVNNSNNWWQMQEHAMYGGTFPAIIDGFFGIDDTTFTMDSGSTNAQRGQVVAFKQFNKTEFNSTGGYGDVIYSSQFGGDGLHGWGPNYAIGQSFTTTQSETVSSIDFNTSWRSGCTALTSGEIIPFIYSISESIFYVNGTDQMGTGLDVTGVAGYGPSTQHWILDNPITIPPGSYVGGHLLDSVTGGGGGCFMDWGADLISNGNQPGTSQLDGNWKTGVTFAEYSTTWDLGILVNGLAYPDIRVQGGIMSLGSSDDIHLHVEVRDGNFQAGQTMGLNTISSSYDKNVAVLGHDDTAYFERDQFMTFMNSTRDNLPSLGVYDLEDPTLGTANNFDISFRPNWSNSTNDIVTLVVAVQDNSTLGSMIANITSIELENNIKFNFTDINDFVFYEPDCTTGMATTETIDGSSDNDKNCGIDQSNGITETANVTAGIITANVLPTPPNVTDLTAEFTDSIYLDWDHDLVNVTGFRIYRTSTEDSDIYKWINAIDAPSQPQVGEVATITNNHGFKGTENFPASPNVDSAEGKIPVKIDFKARRTNTSIDGFLSGCIVGDVESGGTGDPAYSCLAQTETIDVSDIGLTTLTAGSTLTVNFRGDDLYNMTNSGSPFGADKEGVMIKAFVTAGDVGQSLQVIQANADAGSPGTLAERRENATTWTIGVSNEAVMDVYVLNQTKLYSNSYVLNTGNLTTNYLDEDVEEGNTYFYRVVAINGDVEGDTVFIANETEPVRVGTIDDLQVFPIENNSIFMNWTEPIGDPDFYLIERSDGDKARLGSDDFIIYHETRGFSTTTPHSSGTEFAVAQEITPTTNTNVTSVDMHITRGVGACTGSGVLRANVWTDSGATLVGSGNSTVSGCSLLTTIALSSEVPSFTFDPPVQLSSGTVYQVGLNMTGTIDKSILFARTTADEVTGISRSAATDTFPYTFSTVTGDWSMSIQREDFRLIANITSSETNFTDSSISGLNSTWQWREHDTGGFTPLFTFTVGTENMVQIDSNAGSIGAGYLFKTFNKEDIENSTIRVTWSQSTTQTGQIEVLDGAYDASSMTDFVNNGARATKGAGTLHSSSYAGSITERTTEIQPSEIAYEDSTLPQITVFITALDSSSGAAGTWNIREIDLTKGATFHFPKAIIVTTVSGTTNDYGSYDADSLDHYLQDGVTYFYRVRGQNDIATAVNGSNIAYTKEPVQEDGNSEQITDQTSTRWLYREADSYPQSLGGGGLSPHYDFTTTAEGVSITNLATGYGQGIIMKSFNKTEIFGSNITVGWSATLAAAGATSIRVHDGAYNAKNNPNFPLQDGLLDVGGGQLGFQSAGIFTYTTIETTLTNSSIDWNNSTEDFVTVMALIDSSSGTAGIDVRIQNITISNLGTWVFDDGGTYVVNFEGNTESLIQDFWDNGYYDGANLIATPPGAVNNLVGTAVNATVSLTWDDATGADNYVVLRNGTQIGTPIPSDFIDSSPVNNTFYNYTVYATNTGGDGTSDTAFVLTNDFPSAPQNLTVAMGLVIPDLEDAFLDWDAPLDNGTGSPSTGADIIHYWVERKAGIAAFSFLANTTNATTAYEDETVISSANYTWRVRAVNPVGLGPYSNTFSLITTPLMVPDPPTNLTATAVSGYQINVEWLAAIAGDPPTDYVLQQRHVGFTGFITIATIPAPTLYYNVTGLLPGHTYDYRVRADNGAGSSTYSNIDQAITFGVPSAPLTLTATTINNTAIFLDWVQSASVGTGILNYSIERESPVGGGFVFLINVTGGPPATAYTDLGLTQNTIYNYRVNATNDIGSGPYSNQDNDMTHGVPDAPINLSYTTNGISTITVDWDSPVYTGGVPLTAYTIDQAQGIGGTFFTATPNHPTTPTDKTYTGLLQSTNYIYKIAAKNQYGTGAYSANLTAGTFSGPSEPENFNAVFNATFPYSVNLSWSAPLDDGGKPIAGYLVQRQDLNNIYQLIANLTNSTFSYTDSSLLQKASHVYRIAAFTNPTGDFTADQPVTTVVTPHFQTFTINNFDVLGDVLHQNYTVVIDDCFPACILTQADIERNGIVESNYLVGSAIPLNTPVTFSTYFIIPLTGTQFINTTAIVTNLGSNNSNETGVVTAQLQFVVDTLFFNHTRVNNFQDINFTLVRHPIPWDAECTHVIASTFLTPSIGVSGTQPIISLQGVGSFNDLIDANPSQNSYIACYDPVNTQILAFTSFGSGNGTLALTTFTNQLGDFMGVPVPFIFVLFFAAIWTGRSAPTGIIMLSVLIGFLGVLGYVDPLSGSPTEGSLEAFWGLIVILTLLGVFIGKRFF